MIVDEAGENWADGPAGHGGARRQGYPVDPYRVQRALFGGKRWLIGAGVIGAIVGFLYVKLVMVSDYETTVVLKYEGDMSMGDQRPSAHAIDPAADALLQQSVLSEIREELGFDNDLTELADWIQYETDYRAGTLRFAVSGDTGEDAAEYARVVTQVFMAYHKDRQSRRIEAEIGRTEKRIDAVEHEAEAARRRYNAFRERHGISNLPTEQQSMLESAAQLRADSELAVPEIRALEAQVSSLETLLAEHAQNQHGRRWGLARESHVRATSAGAGERTSLAFPRSPAGSSASAAGGDNCALSCGREAVRPPAAAAWSASTRPIKTWPGSFKRRNRIWRLSGNAKKDCRGWRKEHKIALRPSPG